MEIKALELSEAQSFIDFFTKLVRETDFLLPTVAEAGITGSEQETIIKNFNDFKQVFIAKTENEIVGFIGITRLNSTKSRHIANFALGILKQYQRQHIATELLHQAEKWLKELGVYRLEITVIENNIPALAFYKKHGFTQEGIRKNSIFMNNQYYNEIYMAKFL